MHNTMSRLAEEVLAMILAPSLTVSYAHLTSKYSRAFGGNDVVPSSSVLLVCKRWLRVATPLLYETVVIRSTGQSYALAEALQLNPSFARYIKNVRLEGAYGGVYDILKQCKKLSTLVLFLNIYSESRITCLLRALPTIDPKHVFLYDSGGIDNVKFRRLLRALCDAIPTWKNLTTFGYPYSTLAGTVRLKPDNRTRRTLLCEALIQCKSLRLVHCDEMNDHIDVHSLQTLTQVPSIVIRIVYSSPDDDIFYRNVKEHLIKDISTNHLLSVSSFEFVTRDKIFSPFLTTKRRSSPVDSISFNNDSVMRVPDVIWADIFLLATTPSNNTSARDRAILREVIKRVCERFSRVISYISYTHPLLQNSTDLRQFTQEIRQTPYLGNLVLELSLFDTFTFDGHACMVADLCALFPHLTSLRHLYISRSSTNGMLLLPPLALTLLAKAAGESLRSIKLDFRPNMHVPPNVLSSFKKLVNIDMLHACPFSIDNTGLELDTLATLQELHLGGTSTFLSTLTVLRLPQLRVVVFSGSPVDAFMEVCGTNIEELHFSGTANFAALFRNAPKLRLLRWGLSIRKQRQCLKIIEANFRNFGSHPTLTKVVMVDLPGYRCDTEGAKVLRSMFDQIRFAEFPSLKEINFGYYRWPDDERSIQRDVLPGIATKVKQDFGIDVTDSTGKPWRPRVQKDRHFVSQIRASVSIQSNGI